MSSSIGLDRRKVVLVPYREEWKDEFIAEQRILRNALGDLVLDIKHVGGTAVENSIAKPIIDIAVAVEDHSQIEALTEKLIGAGYRYETDAGSDGGHIFMKFSQKDITTHHIHVVELRDRQWRNYLNFRDALRRDKALHEAYAQRKTTLSQKYPDDRDSYTVAKTEFIVGVLAEE